jgi:hypothetical protein
MTATAGDQFGRKEAQKAQKKMAKALLFFAPFVPFCGHSSVS